MEAPTRDPGVFPVIKCSSCGNDVAMAGLAEHQCAPTPPSVSVMPPPPPRTDSSNSLRPMRSNRPLLPRIDPSVGVRPYAHQGELTPASSGPNSLYSPVSAGSGGKSPWATARKGSLPGPRRPPSPELTNLDCAFPPFPTPARAATTKQRSRSTTTTQRDETKRSRSRDGHKDGKQRNRRPTLAREGTAGSKSTDALPTLKQPRPTSPLSNEVKLDGQQGAAEKVPAIPFESLVAKASLPDPPLNRNAPSQTPEGRLDPNLSAFDFGGSVTSTTAPTPDNPDFSERPRADTEPAYKSKRPPPILSNQEILPLAKSSTAPQPSPSGSFFGRLLRRRSQSSTTSRRDVVRQALSDEPDSFDQSFAGQSILSPGSDRSYFTAEPSPLGLSPLASPAPLPSHEESLKALEGVVVEPPAAITPVVVVEPAAESPKRSAQVLPDDFDAVEPPPELSDPFEHAAGSEGSELIEALRRVSIDSASSYGSVGFSERTTSSRSTAPHEDPSHMKSATPLESILDADPVVDMPAPLRPKALDVSPDSPTDPLFLQGRLSPIPDSTHRSQDSLDSLPAIQIERRASPEPVQESRPSSNEKAKGKPLLPNKGTCRGCSQLILTGQKSVSSADGRLTGRYHKECFVCQACKTSFPTAEFYVHNDHPYCAHHYHELEDSLCASCGRGIEGLYMETANVAGRGKEKHHPECLKCTTCKVRLDHDYFELSGKVYCERDAFRMANLPKSHDNAPSRPSPLVREYISSGDPGLAKGRNFPERRTTKLMNLI